MGGRIIVGIKAVRSLAHEHIAQVLDYLKTTGLHVGLPSDFGAKKTCCRRFAL